MPNETHDPEQDSCPFWCEEDRVLDEGGPTYHVRLQAECNGYQIYLVMPHGDPSIAAPPVWTWFLDGQMVDPKAVVTRERLIDAFATAIAAAMDLDALRWAAQNASGASLPTPFPVALNDAR